MSFGLFWLSTVIMSDFMFIVSIFRAIKDLVDEGYKLTAENKTLEKEDNDNSNISTILILLVPVANILSMLSFSALIINNKNILFDIFKSKNMLKEMTKEEIEEYRKNPTLLNAVKTCLKRKQEEKREEKLEFKLSFENLEGQINYALENSEVKIISSTVDSNKYDEDTQKNIVSSVLKLVYENEFNKFASKEEFDKYILSNPNVLLDQLKNYKVTKENEAIIKRNYLLFKLMDKYNEAMFNKKAAEKLEKEELTSEKLELINKLKSKYKELILEAAKIDSDLSKSNNEEEKEINHNVNEERILKK